MKKYSDNTYNSSNPIARYAHRERFSKSISSIPLANGLRILDFGCGDGKFLNAVHEKFSHLNLELIGYEPYMESVQDNKVQIFNSLGEIPGNFDVVTCFEVLEHFNSQKQGEVIGEMFSKLKENGTVIISVPIEIGFPSFVKNLRRVFLHYSKEYSIKNIIKSAMAIPIPESRNRNGYLSHMGFNHRELENILQKKFYFQKKYYSPFKNFGFYINSQVFYELVPRKLPAQE